MKRGYVSIAGAAQILGVDVQALHKSIAAGELEAELVGTWPMQRKLIRRAALSAFRARGEAQQGRT